MAGLDELERRRRKLAERRRRVLAVIASTRERGGADALARKPVEDLVRLIEAARVEARGSYVLEGRRIVLRVKAC